MPGLVIKKYREMRSLSQKFVAGKMGISQNAYSKIENNQTQLTVQHVKKLSAILEVPITDLLKDDFEIHKPITLSRTVTRADLLEHVKDIEGKLQAKHAVKHESYVVAQSLLIAVDHTLTAVH